VFVNVGEMESQCFWLLLVSPVCLDKIPREEVVINKKLVPSVLFKYGFQN
jgi:hypothetical protein